MLRPGCELPCPACSHRQLQAFESEAQKFNWLGKALGPWSSSLERVRAVSGEARWGYRDKVLLHASNSQGQWEFGMLLRRGREEKFVAIPSCPVHTDRSRSFLRILSEQLPSDLKLVFVSISGALVTLVLKEKKLDNKDGHADLLPAAQALLRGGAEGIFLNFNPAAGNRVFSSRGWVHFLGKKTSRGYLEREYGPQSFQQLIPSLYGDALDQACQWLEPRQGDLVLDLCSGLGLTLKKWREQGAEAFGVELLGEAAKLAGPGVFQGRASERIPQLRAEVSRWRDSAASGARLLVFANPPRLGLEKEVVQWLSTEARAQRIAYLSCSAGTLSQNLAKLAESAYVIRRIIPYDFFPQTSHIEALACLELDSAACISGSFHSE